MRRMKSICRCFVSKCSDIKSVLAIKAKLSLSVLHTHRKNVFVIANMGLWFNDRNAFSRSLDSSLNWLNDIGSVKAFNNKVFWHETMSQHWPNQDQNGYFNLELGKEHKFHINDSKWRESPSQFHVPGCCVSIDNLSEEAGEQMQKASWVWVRVDSIRRKHV